MNAFKHLILITSCINVDTRTPLAYFHTRSLFSHEERFEHTKLTIETTRAKFPGATLVLADNNGFTDTQRAYLEGKVDHLFETRPAVLIGEVTVTQAMLREHPNKSFAECALMLDACRRITEMGLEFDYFWKMAGRYQILETFDLKQWPVTTEQIVTPRSGDGVVCCVLMSVPKARVPYFMDRCTECALKCYHDGSANRCGVEKHLFDYTNPAVHTFLSIPTHVGGYCAIHGNVWFSC